jgi:hypothetical protein
MDFALWDHNAVKIEGFTPEFHGCLLLEVSGRTIEPIGIWMRAADDLPAGVLLVKHKRHKDCTPGKCITYCLEAGRKRLRE